MDELPHPKHTSVLPDICHHHTDSRLFSEAFSKLSLNLTMRPLIKSVIFKKISYSIEDYLLEHRRKNNYHIQLFIFLFVYFFFHFDF